MRLKYAMQTRMCSFDSTKAAGDVLESAIASTFNLRLLDRGPGHRSSARSREGRLLAWSPLAGGLLSGKFSRGVAAAVNQPSPFLALFEQYSDF